MLGQMVSWQLALVSTHTALTLHRHWHTSTRVHSGAYLPCNRRINYTRPLYALNTHSRPTTHSTHRNSWGSRQAPRHHPGL
jgi:hypothetical protein